MDNDAPKPTVMENDAPNLPREIITNILVRLPVKSLIRFQCVCRYWNNLFKTPSFISEHLHHSTQGNPLLAVDWTVSEGNPCRLSLLNREMQFLEFLQNSHITDSLLSGFVYSGSCNGLLCVVLEYESQQSYCLWNPAIRKFRQVPQSLMSDEWDKFTVGFGFSPIINDYKIVKLFDLIFPGHEGEVYALSTGLWRKIELRNLEGIYGLSCRHFAFNGAIFWFGCELVIDSKKVIDWIVSFDIATEVITFIPFPTTTPVHGSHYKALTSYENKLAIFFPIRVGNSESYMIDVWVLEESTDPSRERWSWTNVYTSRPNPYNFIISPETIWRNEIVCTVKAKSEDLDEDEEENLEEKVVLCNLTTDEFNLFDIPRPTSEIFNYLESLLLLDDIHV